MHMQGTPEMMQKKPQYKDVTIDVLHFFQRKIQKLNDIGFQQIIIDPGFGFGKTMTHNYQLLNNLKQFQQLSFALLVGTSRKSMIHTLLDTDAQNSLNGTSVTNTIALYHGASILRVHDVKEAMECIKIVNFAKIGITNNLSDPASAHPHHLPDPPHPRQPPPAYAAPNGLSPKRSGPSIRSRSTRAS